MYERASRVRYSEVDGTGHMTLSALLMRMEDTCVFHLDALGEGPKELSEEQRAWLITSWQVVLHRMPEFGCRTVTRTWGYRIHAFEGDRNFEVTDEDGELFAEANSRWVYYDMAAQKPIRVPKDRAEAMRSGEQNPRLTAPRRIELPDQEAEEKKHIIIGEQHIDTNQHVNNLQYIRMAMKYLPEGYPIHELRVEYIRQCLLGDEVIPLIWQTEEAFYVSLTNMAGSPCAIIQFMI
ncbi:MAG: thioesterase [Lachnospiraceae bacterium]|nr:thioesterase [Lachnospiraceae bacterium]